MSSPKAASIERKAEDFELTDQGLLCRRVHDAADGEVQLRVAVPTGGTSWMEVPGVGAHELKMSCLSIATVSSEDILVGIRSICDWKDWWPGMYCDVVLWCQHCLACQEENSKYAVSAWSQTERYDRPFRALRFDFVTCADHGGEVGNVTGAKIHPHGNFLLLSMGLFSRLG